MIIKKSDLDCTVLIRIKILFTVDSKTDNSSNIIFLEYNWKHAKVKKLIEFNIIIHLINFLSVFISI